MRKLAMKGPQTESASTYRFKARMDRYGKRLAISLDNERGCPHKCKGCGVYKEARIVSALENKECIRKEVERLEGQATGQYHIIVYNSGSVASHNELSPENLDYLLKLLNELNPGPGIVTLNTRGLYITNRLLKRIAGLGPSYRVDFNLGIESLTKRGREIYGKPGIARELAQAFSRLKRYNEKHSGKFGLMANFIYLPEAYLEEGEKREQNREKARDGFIREISGFIREYADKGVPIRINLHPFYRVNALPYDDSSLEEFMGAVEGIREVVGAKNRLTADESMKVSIFIGTQDRGYERKPWKGQIKKWQPLIEEINSWKGEKDG